MNDVREKRLGTYIESTLGKEKGREPAPEDGLGVSRAGRN